MKRLSFLFLTVTLLLFSCSKDELNHSSNDVEFKLTDIEKEFFDWNKSVDIQSRRGTSYRITPEVIKIHRHVMAENAKNNFAEGIQLNVGTPLWNHAYSFKTGSSDYYVLVPLYNQELSLINGYISGMKTSDRIILNGLTRSFLLSEYDSNSGIKSSALRVLAKQEKLLKGKVSPEIDEALCILNDKIRISGFQHDGTKLRKVPCVPEIREICIDQEGGYHWFGGMENLPPDLDHDQDGIINSEDQDWHERRFDMDQEEFTRWVLEYWNKNMYEDYGDYYDFWEEMGDYADNYDGGQDWNDVADRFQDMWDAFGDFMDDLWQGINDAIDDIGEWWDGLFRDDIECPYPIRPNTEQIETRSVECFSFFAWDCLDNPDENWWSFYDGYGDDVVFRHRLAQYWELHLSEEVDLFVLIEIAKGCDPLSSNFEQCVQSKWNKERDNMLNYFFTQEFNSSKHLKMTRLLAKNCKYTGSETAYEACIMKQYNTAKADIESFLTDKKIGLTFQEFIEIFVNNCSSCNMLNYKDEATSVLIDNLNLGSEFGLSIEEIQHLKNNFNLDDQKINISFKLDWSQINDQKKISHIYYCLAFINRVYTNYNMDPIVSYELKDFFTNVSGTAMKNIVEDIDLAILGPNKRVNGKQYKVEGTVLNITEIYEPNTFYWSPHVIGTHMFFPKTGSGSWGFAIIDFIVPEDQWQKFYYVE